MEDGWCPRICLAVMIGSLLLYFPLEYLAPDWMHGLSGFALLCSMMVFLIWCGACSIIEHRRRANASDSESARPGGDQARALPRPRADGARCKNRGTGPVP